MLIKPFFIHFNNTFFVAELNRKLVGFLIGFLSQTYPDEAYIHFGGVHPNMRLHGLMRILFQRFLNVCKANNRSIIRSAISPLNKDSIEFHKHMGFTLDPGDGEIDGLPVTLNYHRRNDPKVTFKKILD